MKKILNYGLVLLALILSATLMHLHDERQLYQEYKRGIMIGAGYYQRHGEYPSMWHWEHAFYNDHFNIDTILKRDPVAESKELLIWRNKVDAEMGIDTVIYVNSAMYWNGKYDYYYDSTGNIMYNNNPLQK